jgi:hypothetical protein
MITCTSGEQIARRELAHEDHAGHAAVIRHVTTQDDGAALRWTTVHDTPASALAELDRIAAGAGNYAYDRFASIEIGTAFDLLRNHVTYDG